MSEESTNRYSSHFSRSAFESKIQETADKLGVTVDFTAEIQVGDLYLAVRNGPVKLLTCKRVVKEENLLGGFIIPTTVDYVYDVPECVKVVL